MLCFLHFHHVFAAQRDGIVGTVHPEHLGSRPRRTALRLRLLISKTVELVSRLQQINGTFGKDRLLVALALTGEALGRMNQAVALASDESRAMPTAVVLTAVVWDSLTDWGKLKLGWYRQEVSVVMRVPGLPRVGPRLDNNIDRFAVELGRVIFVADLEHGDLARAREYLVAVVVC